MKPGRFTYHAPREVDEALDLLAEHGDDAKVLAGGQSLMPLLNFRMAAPEHLVDINRLPGLAEIRRESTGWSIPASSGSGPSSGPPRSRADVPLLPAGAAAGRAPADPQPRHGLRQPRPR